MRHLAAAVYTMSCANSSISNVERRADGSAAVRAKHVRAVLLVVRTPACMCLYPSARVYLGLCVMSYS